MNNYKSISILLFFLVTACKHQTAMVTSTIVSLRHYQLITLDSNSMDVKLVEEYPITEGNKLPQNCANLYICKKFNSDEVILLFDLDKKAPIYKIDSNSKDIVYSIYKKDVKSNPPLDITVYVPKNFVIPKKSKYLVASLSDGLD